MEKTNRQDIRKIAIIGPESTGKSAMAEYLANQFRTLWVPEYAREYCSRLNCECTLEDELAMFYGQLRSEEEALSAVTGSLVPLLFCDTTIITVKIWCEHVFGSCPAEVQQEYERRHYDLYLLMNNDLPWEDDPLRNFPNERNYFFDWYERLMIGKNANYRIISGINDERRANALNAINEFLGL